MHAPAHICRLLGSLHPKLPIRLGWDGARIPAPGADPGTFALLQLYHRSDVFRSDGELKTYRHRWGGLGDFGEDHGVLYGKDGRPRPDWDPWKRIPIYVLDVPPEWVFDGRIISEVKRWIRPIVIRAYLSAVEEAKAYDSKIQDMGEQMGDDLHRRNVGLTGGRGANGRPILAREFIRPDRKLQRYLNGDLDFSKQLKFKPPPGGWDRFLRRDEGDANDLGSISSGGR